MFELKKGTTGDFNQQDISGQVLRGKDFDFAGKPLGGKKDVQEKDLRGMNLGPQKTGENKFGQRELTTSDFEAQGLTDKNVSVKDLSDLGG